jgi:hypothetical protein
VRRVAVIVFAAIAIVPGAYAPRAMEPCGVDVVQLTGTLVEVEQDGASASTEAAILDGVPRRVCLSVQHPLAPNTLVQIVDCDFPDFKLNVAVEP